MSTTKRGLFITFEGPEGSGKSTQLRRLAARLRAEGRTVLETAEPGGTAIGMQIRRVLLDAKNHELRPTTELLLMFAARAQNVDELILPALSRGEIVLCDRFTDSSLVYQGVARGLGADVVYDVDRIACRGLVPDLTIVVDIATELGLERARARNQNTRDVETRLDEQAVDFHRKVRDAYLQLAADEPNRVKLVDGSGSEDNVEKHVWEAVESPGSRQGL
ncbi:MAG TPA: dTMP kinase [Bryobacteraceae bacterium]|nr:dTMP kinase [Bryobacteraceae bacterium]